MKIVKPEAHYLGKVPTDYEGALKFIEMAGRTCYRSEDKITPGSAEKFVRKLIAAGHLAMIEHSNFVVRIDVPFAQVEELAGKYLNVYSDEHCTFVGGNLTAWAQQEQNYPYSYSFFHPFMHLWGKLFDMQDVQHGPCFWELCNFDEIPPELHRHAVRFVCNRGVSHRLVRHRPCSFAQESTRYVNYGRKDMEFVEPDGFYGWPQLAIDTFKSACLQAELNYKGLLKDGLSPQQACAVLPNALRTEIVVTADAAEWEHIKNLRTALSADPDIRRLMSMVPWEDICPAI